MESIELDKMRCLYERIQLCAKHDRADSAAKMMMYIVEEVGEISTCISVEEGMKDRKLTEPKESEACDVIISTLGLIAKNPEWNFDKVLETIGAKLPKWESRVIKGTTDDESNKG
jgi:NTP pyrophosphatase (non-canonical NTP hydrolase)